MIQRSVGNSLAAIAGFWFVGSLHLQLTARGPSTAAWAAFGGGVALVTLLLAGSAIRSDAVVGSLAGDPLVGKIPTTLVRRRISLFNRSWGLLDQICFQCALGNPVNAKMSPPA